MSESGRDLDAVLRNHFEREVDGIDGTEDWGDLTGRIRARARRRVRMVSSAAAVAVIAGLGVGFAAGDRRSSTSSDTAGSLSSGSPEAPASERSSASSEATASDDSGAGKAPPATGEAAPGIAADGSVSDQAGTESGSPDTASSRAVLAPSVIAPTGRRTGSGVTLTTWSCSDGSTTIDASAGDTVGRLVVGPVDPASVTSPSSGPPLAASAILEGIGRPRQLVVIGVTAPGATRLRATFPDGTTDTADVTDVTGPVAALGSSGSAPVGSTILVESLAGASDRVVAEVTVTLGVAGTQRAPNC